MPAARKATAAQKKPPQEYSFAVLAVHPVTGKAITKAVIDDEVEAHKDCARRNQDGSHFSHHVKRIKKGTSGQQGGTAPSRNR